MTTKVPPNLGRLSLPVFSFSSALMTLVVSCLCSGCSWTDKNGTHHLIVGLGFGVITTTNRLGVDILNAHVLGATIGSDVAGVGWVQNHHVSIDPQVISNLVISVKATPFSTTVRNFNPE